MGEGRREEGAGMLEALSQGFLTSKEYFVLK